MLALLTAAAAASVVVNIDNTNGESENYSKTGFLLLSLLGTHMLMLLSHLSLSLSLQRGAMLSPCGEPWALYYVGTRYT